MDNIEKKLDKFKKELYQQLVMSADSLIITTKIFEENDRISLSDLLNNILNSFLAAYFCVSEKLSSSSEKTSQTTIKRNREFMKYIREFEKIPENKKEH